MEYAHFGYARNVVETPEICMQVDPGPPVFLLVEMVGRCLLREIPSRKGYPKKSFLRKMQSMDNMVEHYQRSQKAAQDIHNGNNQDETLCDV